MNKLSKDREWYINLAICLCAFLSLEIFPFIVSSTLKNVIKNGVILNLINSALMISFLIFLFYKDLKVEFKTFKKNLSFSLKTGFKYYIMGIGGMIISSLIITQFTGGTSANESSVRELLLASPVFMLINISLLAPITEELIFRKSIQPLIKNKWVRAIISALLFGGAHLLTGDAIRLVDLLFLLPYGSLGFVFSLMDSDTKTTFTSITYHGIHNAVTGILLLLVSSLGVAI